MAAHLGGVVAAHTELPVLSVPLAAGTLGGLDALLATAQMPGGVPVACFGIGAAGGKNAAYMAARILALSSPEVAARLHSVLTADHDKILSSRWPQNGERQ